MMGKHDALARDQSPPPAVMLERAGTACATNGDEQSHNVSGSSREAADGARFPLATAPLARILISSRLNS